MKRHLLSGLVAVAALSLALTGCAGTDKSEDPGADPTDSKTTYTIGIATYVSHPALQAVQDGFEEVLKEEGISYTVVSQNGLGDPANSATIANAFAADQSLDLILAITTPIALAMATAEQDRPILFSAVTDPVEVGLVPSWDQAGFNVTGTSDLNPDARPVALVKEAMPDVKTIGVLYSSSEANSLIQLRAYEAEA
ncbi:MAG: sugar ABC transporter substrate-binding protein, partial [Propionibacteriaceae bacterium]|nr:sugar ABC transporter substrate-binding protein [Propionibacteriaceae bacterium]